MAESANDDDRAVELSSIAAIYPEIKIDPSLPLKASLELPVVTSKPLHVSFQRKVLHDPEPTLLTPPTSPHDVAPSLNAAPKDASGEAFVTAPLDLHDRHSLSYLPPLILKVELPQGYPYLTPPSFKLSTNPPWLPAAHIARLQDDGRRLWEECGKEFVVYTYIDHLQQLADTAFGLSDSSDGEIVLSRDLKVAILDFNSKAERERFEQETFECGVCLEPKKGVNCYRLLQCSHVFCVPCLQDFYNTCISEGDVDNVRCLAPDCGKEAKSTIVVSSSAAVVTKKRKKRDCTLSPSELLQIPLEQETVQRYVFLKRKKKLEADRTVVYCPRQWCQGPARSKRHPKPVDPLNDDPELSDEEEGLVFDPMGEESQLPPMPDRVAVCEECNYAFCSVCKKGWHGELVRCFPRRQAELSAEEKATEEYLRMYTTPCPTCKAPCQKLMGCNHMKCFKCNSHFCYLCSAWLSEYNPYSHFNDINSRCYNRLWDLEGGDGLDPAGAEALHQIPDVLIAFDDDDSDGPALDEESDDEQDDPAWEFNNDAHANDVARFRRPPPPAPVPPRAHALNGPEYNRRGLAAAAVERPLQVQRPTGNQTDQHRQQPGAGQRGLQRFLDLVRNDREDEWDSDELDDDF